MEAEKQTYTIFYQGMTNSQTQISKYIGKDGFVSTTGELIICNKPINVINNLYIGPEIDEVEFRQIPHQYQGITNTIYSQMYYFCTRLGHWYYGINVLPYNRTDKSLDGYSVKINKINLGQEDDLASHKIKYDAFLEDHPNDDLILYGVSRGAATTFNAVSLNGYDKNKIRLVILEGCYDSIENIIKEKFPYGSYYLIKSLDYLPIGYERDGINPIKNVAKFPKDIPVVFITSKIDMVVPNNCTKNLARELVKCGHNEVYLLELEESSHPKYMMDSEKDSEMYENFIHALYEKYNLTFNKEKRERLVVPLNPLSLKGFLCKI